MGHSNQTIFNCFNIPDIRMNSAMDIVKEWKKVNHSVTTQLSSVLPKDCTPVMLIGCCSITTQQKVVEEWGEQQWELLDWEVEAALGWGIWDWVRKPLR